MSTWNLSTEIAPNYDGGLMRAKWLIGGIRNVKTKAQRNAITALYRYMTAQESTIVFVESENQFYKLINNPSGTTTDGDWELMTIGGVASSLNPIGTWTYDNTEPVLSDDDAAGNNGDFYFVTGAPTPQTVTHAGLFEGGAVTVVDGNMIVSVGTRWVVVANSTAWNSIDKPQVIVDYVAGTVIAHTHTTDDISDLAEFLSDYLTRNDTADHTVDFDTVPDTSIPEIEFLKTHYYTKEEVNNIISDIDVDGGITEFIDLVDTPAAYTGHAGKAVTVNALETALEFTDFSAQFWNTGSDTVITDDIYIGAENGESITMEIIGTSGTGAIFQFFDNVVYHGTYDASGNSGAIQIDNNGTIAVRSWASSTRANIYIEPTILRLSHFNGSNNVARVEVEHTVSPAAAAGLGSGIDFKTESATNFVSISGGYADVVSTSITLGSESYDFVLSLRHLGAIGEKFRISSAGLIRGIFTQDDALTKVLVADADGDVYWRDASTLGGGGGGGGWATSDLESPTNLSGEVAIITDPSGSALHIGGHNNYGIRFWGDSFAENATTRIIDKTNSQLTFDGGNYLGVNGIKFTDNRTAGNKRGIEYTADYSADFGDRSLVDKAYVLSVAGGGGGGGGWALTGTTTLTGSVLVDGATNTISFSSSNFTVDGTNSITAGDNNTNNGLFGTAVFGEDSIVDSVVGAGLAVGESVWIRAYGGKAFGRGSRVNLNADFALVGGMWTPGSTDPTTNNKVPQVSGFGAFGYYSTDTSQTDNHGVLGAYAAILGGLNHNIPSDSPRSAIIGGNAIKARAADADQVYVPNLNIVETPTNDDALTNVLVWDSSTKEVKTRSASSLGAGGSYWTTSGTTVLTGSAVIDMGTNGVLFQGEHSLDPLKTGHLSFETDGFQMFAWDAAGTQSATLNFDGGSVLAYGSDYSARFVDLSLVHKGYVLGAKTFTGKQSFTHGSAAGFNIGSVAGDPGTLVDGDMWYDSTNAKFRVREGGVSKDMTNPYAVIEDVTGTTYTFTAADHFKIKRFTNASGCTATVPTGLRIGWTTTVYRGSGAGTVTIASLGTLESADTTLDTAKTAATIFNRGTDIHVAVGALGAGGGGGGITNSALADELMRSDGTNAVGSGIYVTSDGRLYGSALHNNAGSLTGTTNQYIASGTYTPTITGVLQVTSLVAKQCHYVRTGNVVFVSGSVGFNSTASTGGTQLRISLPIASSFTNILNLSGHASPNLVNLNQGAIQADTINDEASLTFNNGVGATSATIYYFTFSYEVL